MRVIFERCTRTKILRNLYKLFCYSSLLIPARYHRVSPLYAAEWQKYPGAALVQVRMFRTRKKQEVTYEV